VRRQLTAERAEVFAEGAESSGNSLRHPVPFNSPIWRSESLILIGITSTLVSIALPGKSLEAQSKPILGTRAPRPHKRAQHAKFQKLSGNKAASRFALIAGEAPALPVVTGSVQIRSTLRAMQISPSRSLAFAQTKPDKDYLVYVVSGVRRQDCADSLRSERRASRSSNRNGRHAGGHRWPARNRHLA
jgi:hypothetical protein